MGLSKSICQRQLLMLPHPRRTTTGVVGWRKLGRTGEVDIVTVWPAKGVASSFGRYIPRDLLKIEYSYGNENNLRIICLPEALLKTLQNKNCDKRHFFQKLAIYLA